MAIFEIGHIIAATRRYDYGMTQSELAAKVGVSRNEISAIENQSANPRLITIMKILDVLGLELAIVRRSMK